MEGREGRAAPNRWRCVSTTTDELQVGAAGQACCLRCILLCGCRRRCCPNHLPSPAGAAPPVATSPCWWPLPPSRPACLQEAVLFPYLVRREKKSKKKKARREGAGSGGSGGGDGMSSSEDEEEGGGSSSSEEGEGSGSESEGEEGGGDAATAVAREAARQVEFSQQTQTILLRGLVRPEDISQQNQVLSTAISSLELEVKGKGIINDYTHRQNPLVRWLQKILVF